MSPPERGWPITATGTARSSSNQVQPGGATPAPPDSPGSASLAHRPGRAWPCTCGGSVRFSAATLAAYASGDGEVLVTVEQAAHNHSARHAAWSERSLWRFDAYERRRDLEET